MRPLTALVPLLVLLPSLALADADADGYSVTNGDCDDADASVHPYAVELCDGVDSDCDTVPDAGQGPLVGVVGGSALAEALPGFAGNEVLVDRDVIVGEIKQRVSVPAGTDLTVVVLRFNPITGWYDDVVVSRPMHFATANIWVALPQKLRMMAGERYLVGVTVDSGAVTFHDAAVSVRGLTPLSSVYDPAASTAQPLPPPSAAMSAGDAYHQEWEYLVDLETDMDGDGFRPCDGDCMDGLMSGAATVFPGAAEQCDGFDSDCDGVANFAGAPETDADGDGSLSCEDCDDADPLNAPGFLEECDGFDNDCNGVADFDALGEADDDQDGYLSCEDCDDTDSALHTATPEVCNTVDDDCDGNVDEDFDGDGDGVTSCGPDGVSPTPDDDCDDADPAAYPGAPEDLATCDLDDSNCDGSIIDPGDQDIDFDGTPDCAQPWWQPMLGAGWSLTHGAVTDGNGNPVSGVTVSADPNHCGSACNLNPTTTDGNGDFVLAAEPGSGEEEWVLVFSKPGWSPAFRRVRLKAGEQTAIREIPLLQMQGSMAVVPQAGQATQVTDPATGWSLTFPAGSVASSFNVSVTPMPEKHYLGALLPTTSAFTYAVHIESDGPTSFSAPVVVEFPNSRGFPDGTEIPVGWYDESIHEWVHMTTAQVVNGGTTVRYETDHFSFHDINLALFGPSSGGADEHEGEEETACGMSGVGYYHQFLTEQIRLPGYNFLDAELGVELGYSAASLRPELFLRVLNEPDDRVVPPLKLALWAQLQGLQAHEVWLAPDPTETALLKARVPGLGASTTGDYLATGFYDYDWQIDYTYPASFAETGSFGASGGASIYSSTGSGETFSRPGSGRTFLQNRAYSPYGAGWGITGLQELHIDTVAGTGAPREIVLTDGRGEVRRFQRGDAEVFGGDGSTGAASLGGPALASALDDPTGLAFATSGDLYVSLQDQHCIVRIDPAGDLHAAVGTCGSGASSPSLGGAANSVQLKEPGKLALDGSTLYFVEEGFDCVRSVDPSGRMSTVAGDCGNGGYDRADTPQPALGLRMKPTDVAKLGPGGLLITDKGGAATRDRVLLVDLGYGTAETIVGDRTGSWLDPARRILGLRNPVAVDVLDDGAAGNAPEIVVLDGPTGSSGVGAMAWKVRLGGDDQYERFAGSGFPLGRPHGSPADEIPLGGADDVAVGPDGWTYISNEALLVAIDPDGRATTALGTGVEGFAGDDGPARRTLVGDLEGIAIDPVANVVFVAADGSTTPAGGGNRVWRIDREVWWSPKSTGSWRLDPGLGGAWTLQLGGGAEAVFDSTLRLAQVHDGLPAAVRHHLQYSYLPDGRLSNIQDSNGDQTWFHYGGDGLLERIIDPAGRVTTFTMAGGDLRGVEFPDGETWSLTYDEHLLTSKTDGGGATTDYVYDVRPDGEKTGRVVAVHQPEPNAPSGRPSFAWSPAWDFGLAEGLWDGTNKPTAHLSDEETTVTLPPSPNGGTRELLYRYGDDLRLAYAQDEVGREQWFDWDEEASVATIVDDAGTETTLWMDVRGRVTEFEIDDDPTAYGRLSYALAYDDLDRVVGVAGDGIPTTTRAYDPATHQLLSSTVGGETWTYSYDPATGRLDGVTDPEGRTTSYGYDAQERLASVDPGGIGAWSLGYDAAGNVVSSVGPGGLRPYYSAYDEANRPIQAWTDENPLAPRAWTWRSSDGSAPGPHLESVQDETGESITFDYDGLGRMTSMQYPTAPAFPAGVADDTVVATWADEGPLLGVGDRAGYQSQLHYDAFGRVSQAHILDLDASGALLETIGYDYDAHGRPDEVASSSGSVWSATYDGFGRPVTLAMDADPSSGAPGYQHVLAYDAKGRLDTVTTTVGAASWTQEMAWDNQTEVLEHVQLGTGETVAFGWDDAGLLAHTKAGGRYACIERDAAGRVTGTYFRNSCPPSGSWTSGTWQSIEYDLDPDGTIVGWIENASGGSGLRDVELGVDDALRIHDVAWLAGGGTDQAFAYDEVGNRDVGVNTVDARHRLLETAEELLTYDDEGRIETRTDKATGSVIEYVWDHHGQLVEVLEGGISIATFDYDVLGRIARSDEAGVVRYYVHVGEDLLAVLDGNGDVLLRYIHGPDIDQPLGMVVEATGAFYALDLDVANTVRRVRDVGTGAVVGEYQYDPFGNLLYDSEAPGTEQPLRFQGRPYFAGVGLLNFRARWYDPALGRFLSEDAQWPSQPHPYAFGGNNPTQFRDPTGEYLQLAWAGFRYADAAIGGLQDWLNLNLCMDAASAYQQWTRAYAFRVGMATVEAFSFRGFGGPLGRRCNSVEEGTLVSTPEGRVAIEDLEVGADVFARDAGRGGEVVEAELTGRWRGPSPGTLVEIAAGEDELRFTANHPLYVVGEGWTQAGFLEPGDLLWTEDGDLPVDAVRTVQSDLPVWNLVVEGAESYFVGTEGVWTHNCYDAVASRHGGRALGNGAYAFPSRRAARQAASEGAGDLGSGARTTRKSDYRGGPWGWRRSPGRIGKQSADGSRGWRDDSLGHPQHGMGPHLNVWGPSGPSHFYY